MYLLYSSKKEDMGWKGQVIIIIRRGEAKLYIIPFPFPTHILLFATI